ncbi:MAG TPA: TMEM165/GDT1 family protein [Acidimicrobiia bacterium]|nr:TMEM165/GDT1 family protein [Acidimicrobiia bacterium]
MHLGIVLAVFPLIFFAELPDKTMFASILLASRGRPLAVWAGATAAFVVHVVIAVSVGVGLFNVLPHRAVDALVAVLFAVGAVLAFRESEEEEVAAAADVVGEAALSVHRVIGTSFLVIFLAEWGDLTQVLTANLAARYHSPLSVGLGAALALVAVSAVATFSGKQLVRVLPGTLLRKITGVACTILALVAVIATIRA